MYVHFVCLFAPWKQGVNWARDFQKSSRVELGTFCVRSECRLFQGQVHISSFDS